MFGQERTRAPGTPLAIKVCAQCGGTQAMAAKQRSRLCVGCQYRKNKLAFAGRRREYNLQYQYGISLADFERMLAEQDNKCAICQTPTVPGKLAVDHDHSTGAVRGLLCHPCNRGLGQFKDSEERIVRAVEYLRKARA